MVYTAKLNVRSYECDSYGHVNNACYLNYLEYGRMQYLHEIGFDYNGLVAKGYYLYVTHVDIYYKASSRLDDELTINTSVLKLGAVSGEFLQVISKASGTVCAVANVTWACVKDGKPSRLPEAFRVPGLLPQGVIKEGENKDTVKERGSIL